MVSHTLSPSPPLVCIIPNMNEKINHPIKSLNMADAIMMVPIFVLNIFISIKILDITGNAEIDKAVPKNKENSKR